MQECSSEQREVTALADLLLLRQIFKLFPAGSSPAGGDIRYMLKQFVCGDIWQSDISLYALINRLVNGDYSQQGGCVFVGMSGCSPGWVCLCGHV